MFLYYIHWGVMTYEVVLSQRVLDYINLVKVKNSFKTKIKQGDLWEKNTVEWLTDSADKLK